MGPREIAENADYEDFIGRETSVRKNAKKIKKSACTDNFAIDICGLNW
jgi:hypothetical protein